MALWVKHLPHKVEDLSSDKQSSSKAKWQGRTCLLSNAPMEQ